MTNHEPLSIFDTMPFLGWAIVTLLWLLVALPIFAHHMRARRRRLHAKRLAAIMRHPAGKRLGQNR